MIILQQYLLSLVVGEASTRWDVTKKSYSYKNNFPPVWTYLRKRKQSSCFSFCLFLLPKFVWFKTHLTISNVLINPPGLVHLGCIWSHVNELRRIKWRVVLDQYSKKLCVQIQVVLKVFWCMGSLSGEPISKQEHRPKKSCSTELINYSENQTASLRSLRYSTGHFGSEPAAISSSLPKSTNETWLAGKTLKVAVDVEIEQEWLLVDREGPCLGSLSVPWSIFKRTAA